MRRIRLIALGLFAGCGPTAVEPAHLGLLAPRSLQPVLEPVVAAWELSHGMSVRIGFDEPDRLLRQANGGTPAHVFVSADTRWMDALISDGHVLEQARNAVAYDPLVFVGAAGATPMRDPRDLVLRLDGLLGIADPELPAGELAVRALQETKVWSRLQGRVVFFRTPAQLREGLESGAIHSAVTVQSAALLARDTLATHPFSPDLAFGSTIEVAALHQDQPVDVDAVTDLVTALMDGPDARAGWSRAGLDGLRGPETRPPERRSGPPPSAPAPSAPAPGAAVPGAPPPGAPPPGTAVPSPVRPVLRE